jgi:hypothetical protein
MRVEFRLAQAGVEYDLATSIVNVIWPVEILTSLATEAPRMPWMRSGALIALVLRRPERSFEAPKAVGCRA